MRRALCRRVSSRPPFNLSNRLHTGKKALSDLTAFVNKYSFRNYDVDALLEEARLNPHADDQQPQQQQQQQNQQQQQQQTDQEVHFVTDNDDAFLRNECATRLCALLVVVSSNPPPPDCCSKRQMLTMFAQSDSVIAARNGGGSVRSADNGAVRLGARRSLIFRFDSSPLCQNADDKLGELRGWMSVARQLARRYASNKLAVGLASKSALCRGGGCHGFSSPDDDAVQRSRAGRRSLAPTRRSSYST